MVCAPTVAGLYVTAQLLSPAVPVAVRPQLGALKVPLPGGRLVTPKVTVPLGLVASAGTVTVEWNGTRLNSSHAQRSHAGFCFKKVVVGWVVGASMRVSLEPECVASPP